MTEFRITTIPDDPNRVSQPASFFSENGDPVGVANGLLLQRFTYADPTTPWNYANGLADSADSFNGNIIFVGWDPGALVSPAQAHFNNEVSSKLENDSGNSGGYKFKPGTSGILEFNLEAELTWLTPAGPLKAQVGLDVASSDYGVYQFAQIEDLQTQYPAVTNRTFIHISDFPDGYVCYLPYIKAVTDDFALKSCRGSVIWTPLPDTFF